MSKFKCDQYTKMTTPISSSRKSPEQLQDEADAAFEAKQESERVAYAKRKATNQREAADHAAAVLEEARVQKLKRQTAVSIAEHHAKVKAVAQRHAEENAANTAELAIICGTTGFQRKLLTPCHT
jgi:hypothetical protein